MSAHSTIYNDNENDEEEKNPWMYPQRAPLCDILRDLILPAYLDVPDLVHLSAVSRHYRALVHANDNAIVKTVLTQRQQKDHHLLPSFGGQSPAETLESDPWWVAQNCAAAARRRRIVCLTNDEQQQRQEQQQQQQQQQQFLYQFRARNEEIAALVASLRDDGNVVIDNLVHATQFVCFNESGATIHCHWIDQDGNMVVREGDAIPPANNSTARQSSMDPTIGGTPAHVFHHSSLVSHSFALCWQPGGPPFCIYQQRRTWRPARYRQQGIYGQHAHAICVRPGGEIQELLCNVVLLFHGNRQQGSWYVLYDSQTGRPVPPPPRTRPGAATANVTTATTTTTTDESSSSSSSLSSDQEQQHLSRALAECFYGRHLPVDIASLDPRALDAMQANPIMSIWPQRSLLRQQQLRGCVIPMLGVSPVGETFWQNDNESHDSGNATGEGP